MQKAGILRHDGSDKTAVGGISISDHYSRKRASGNVYLS